MAYKFDYETMIEEIERRIIFQIDFYYFCNESRKPTKEEYEEMYERIRKEINCKILPSDLGIYE